MQLSGNLRLSIRGNALLTSPRLIAVVALAGVLFCGCGRSHTPDARSAKGVEKVTFYVKDMGTRLDLL